MKKFISILTLLFVISFTGCKEDDNSFSIDGTWKGITEKHIEIQDGVTLHNDLEDISNITVTFSINGTYTMIDADFPTDSESGTWVITGTELTMTSGVDTEHMDVMTLNSTTLVLYEEHSDTHNGVATIEQKTFTFERQ